MRMLVAGAMGAAMLWAAGGACAAPQKLYGKSVVVSWSETRVQRREDQSNFRTRTVSHSLSLYVSGAGRVFTRFTANGRGGNGHQDQVGGGHWVEEFNGNSATVYMANTPKGGGIRRVGIEFGDGFASCTANVIRAKQAGRETLIAQSLTSKLKVEIKSVSVSGTSCAVRDGNVFAGH